MALVSEDDPRPPYVQIADHLRASIERGELQPGQRLEPGRQMAQKFGVAPMTVSSAVSLLRDEGLLISTPGRGTFVAEAGRSTSPQANESAALDRRVQILEREVARLRDRVAHLEAGK